MIDGPQLPAYVRAWLDGNGCPPERASVLEGQVQALVDACEPYGGLRWPDKEGATSAPLILLHWNISKPGAYDDLWLQVRPVDVRFGWTAERSRLGRWTRFATSIRGPAARFMARALNITHGIPTP